jgi:hypothetical protein
MRLPEEHRVIYDVIQFDHGLRVDQDPAKNGDLSLQREGRLPVVSGDRTVLRGGR